MSKRLYKIEPGSVSECNLAGVAEWSDEAIVGGEYSVVAYARSAYEALRLCARYDRGTLQPDNIVVDGVTVVALDGDPFRD